MWTLPLYKPTKSVLFIRIAKFYFSHSWLLNIISLLFLASWGTCFTLMKQNLMFWIYFLWGTCLTLLEKCEFLLKLVFRGEAHALPLWNKILSSEFVFLGWGTRLTLLKKSKFFFILVLRGEAHASSLVRKSILLSLYKV